MKKKRLPELGPLEFKLLRILWKQGPLTAPQVLEEHNRRSNQPLAYTTVMTLLGRLAEKGVLAVNRERQPYRFAPAIGREQILGQRVRDFVNLFFDGDHFDLALKLIQDAPLSDDSVEKLQGVLRERSSKTRSRRKSKS